MTYSLYVDKSNLFECDVTLEGASLKSASARVILERADGPSMIYEGSINSSGKCSIKIEKIKEFLSPKAEGEMRLEIIADGAYFNPWNSQYVVDAFKKLTVEVKEPVVSKAPSLTVEVVSPVEKEYQRVVSSVSNKLKKAGITPKNIRLKENKAAVTNYIITELKTAQHSHRASQVLSDIIHLLA